MLETAFIREMTSQPGFLTLTSFPSSVCSTEHLCYDMRVAGNRKSLHPTSERKQKFTAPSQKDQPRCFHLKVCWWTDGAIK